MTVDDRPTCESCWLEWATVPAPAASELTRLCDECAAGPDGDTTNLANAINRKPGKSGLL